MKWYTNTSKVKVRHKQGHLTHLALPSHPHLQKYTFYHLFCILICVIYEALCIKPSFKVLLGKVFFFFLSFTKLWFIWNSKPGYSFPHNYSLLLKFWLPSTASKSMQYHTFIVWTSLILNWWSYHKEGYIW